MSSRQSRIRSLAVAGLIVASGFVPVHVTRARAQTPAAGSPAPSHRLSIVRRDGTMLVSLTAQNALLSDVASEFSRQSGVPVTVSRDVSSERLWAGFVDTPFEQAAAKLTRRVFVDYAFRPNAAAEPVLVQLVGPDEPPSAAPGSASGVLISGNTEDPAAGQSDTLRIALDLNQLTIVAVRQPLALILAAAAETLGVPFMPDYPGGDLVTVSVSDRPEFALLKLAPNVRVRMRADLNKNERTVQRIQLVAP
jgi:hypothetical protein